MVARHFDLRFDTRHILDILSVHHHLVVVCFGPAGGIGFAVDFGLQCVHILQRHDYTGAECIVIIGCSVQHTDHGERHGNHRILRTGSTIAVA